MSRQIPLVPPAVLVDHAVMVSGRAAVGVAWLLRRSVERGELSTLPEAVREEVIIAMSACDVAARAWSRRQVEPIAGSGGNANGKTATRLEDVPAPSLGVAQVMERLGVKERQARNVCAALGRKESGRWVIDAEVLAAELERRGVA